MTTPPATFHRTSPVITLLRKTMLRRPPSRRRRRPSVVLLPLLLLFLTVAVLSSRRSPWFLAADAAPLLQHLLCRRRTRLTWVNGIGHMPEHMTDATPIISSLFGGKHVDYCHNPSSMTSEDDYVGYIGDLTQAGTHKLGRITSEVDALVDHLKVALSAVGKRGRVVHIAHSQGALITNLAARRLKASELRRIEVVAFGGGAALRRTEFPFARCVNYYSINDPLLNIVPSAVKALRSGFFGGDGGVMTTTTTTTTTAAASSSRGNVGGDDEEDDDEEEGYNDGALAVQDEPEFVFLSPRVGDPIVDHGLLSPTYIEALSWEGRRYQLMYQSVGYRLTRTLLLQIGPAGEGLSNAVKAVVLAILRRTVLPFVRFVMAVNAIAKALVLQLALFVWDRIVMPLFSIALVLLEMAKEAVRRLRGNDRYEPIRSHLGASPSQSRKNVSSQNERVLFPDDI